MSRFDRETDGDRGSQREGWPAPEEGSTQPRWKAQTKPRESGNTQLKQPGISKQAET